GDVEHEIGEAEMIFVSVNTPTKTFGQGAGRAADLQYWEKTARSILHHARRPVIVVEKSTLPVRTAEAMERIFKNRRQGQRFEVLSNPEFLAEGTAITDLESPDRVLIGGAETPAGQAAIDELVDIYARWVPRERILTANVWSAELSKLAANAFLAQRVSSLNPHQTQRFVRRMIRGVFNTLAGKRIALFGFAFKANTGGTRESPAIQICQELRAEQAHVCITDPQALEGARQVFSASTDRVAFESDPYKAADGAHAVALLTDWAEYRALDYRRIYAAMERPAFLFDGRNQLDPEELYQ